VVEHVKVLQMNKSRITDIIRENRNKQEAKYYVLKSLNLLILLEMKKNHLRSGRSLIFVPKAIGVVEVIIDVFYCYQVGTKFYLTFFCQG
jgi:hypothetical protein